MLTFVRSCSVSYSKLVSFISQYAVPMVVCHQCSGVLTHQRCQRCGLDVSGMRRPPSFIGSTLLEL